MLLQELFLTEQLDEVEIAGWYNPFQNRYVEIGNQMHHRFVMKNPEMFGVAPDKDEYGEITNTDAAYNEWIRLVGEDEGARTMLTVEGTPETLSHPNTLKFILRDLDRPPSGSVNRVFLDAIKMGDNGWRVISTKTLTMPHQKGELIRWFKGF